MPDDKQTLSLRFQVTEEDIQDWLRTLYRRLGIRTVTFRDGVLGLVNVPAKYVSIIDHMHIAMSNLAAGEKLPEFLPEEERPKKKGRKKT